MTNETREMQKKLFDRIVLGLALIGLISALSALAMGGYTSPWFFRALALIIVALVAFGLRRVSQYVVAAYVLVIQLLGIVTAIFLQANNFGFLPYLFIPVVVVAGIFLSPIATLIVGVISILITLLISIFTQQVSLQTLVPLLIPASLIMAAALLIIESKRYVEKLSDRLTESRNLLRERTLEMMQAQDTIADLQNKSKELKQQLLLRQDEARQLEHKAQEKNEALYQLIKGTIQELDTSVEDVERLIDKIGESASPEEQAESLEKVWQKIYHLNNLVVNLEDIAQIKNQHIPLNYQDVDIAQIIRDVVGTARGLARGKNLEIRCQVPEALPKIPLDPIRIRQALLYVLNNAIKYTDQGIIEIQAEMNSKELLIFVSDTGIGMHREEMEKVFEEFGRGSGTLAQQRQGTGLGLSISKGLIELHGGHMWVTSVLGVGSTFYINLPLERHVAEIPAALPAPILAAEEETTLASELMPTLAAYDKEATVLSRQPENGSAKTPAKPGFGSPVGRFSPTYIGRLVFIALVMLLVMASGVAVLAAFYGPVTQEETAAITTTVSPTAPAAVDQQTTSTAETIALAATSTPSATPSPTATTPPQDTATAAATSPPTQTPANTATPTASSTSTASPTAVPPSPTPKPTGTPTGTPTPTTPPTPTAVPGDTVQPAGLSRSASRLSIVSGQSIELLPVRNGSATQLDTLGALASDSRINWSPQGNQLLFTTNRDGNHEIYAASADGSRITNLTNTPGYDTQPAWSPDGRRIVFSSDQGGNVDIYVMNADGGNLQQLTTSRGFEEWPVWSPDGRKIAFISDRDGNNEIYVMNADGSNKQRLTQNPTDDWPAAWSPDSRRLVFGSNRDGNWNLYVIDIVGGEAQQLTDTPADERDPVWSPDGRTIAFVANSSGNWDVFTLPAPSGKVDIVPVSQWSQITQTPALNERYPTWAP